MKKALHRYGYCIKNRGITVIRFVNEYRKNSELLRLAQALHAITNDIVDINSFVQDEENYILTV